MVLKNSFASDFMTSATFGLPPEGLSAGAGSERLQPVLSQSNAGRSAIAGKTRRFMAVA
jgi:hypothetical protein